MSRTKIWTAGLITMLTLALVAGSAYASGDAHPGGNGGGRRGGHGQAEVVSIGNDEFTIVVRDESEVTVQVDADTRYFGDLESFNDIEVGMTVHVAGIRKGDETAVARAVGAGELPLGERAGGEVTDVDGDSLTIENRDGESLTFQVDGETLFFSRNDEVEDLSDIEVGDHAKIHYEEASDGTLIAKTIAAGTPSEEGRPADSDTQLQFQGADQNG